MSSTRVNPFAAAVGLIATLMLAGCDEPVSRAEPVRPIRAVRVGDLSAVHGREFSGRAEAKTEVDLSFQVSGPLITLPVDVGSKVKAGDVIAAIDPRDYQAALDRDRGNLERARANLAAMVAGARPEEIEQLKAAVSEAQATYEEALSDFERQKALLAQDATTQQDYDISVARRERNSAQLKAAKEALNIGLTGARPEDLEAKRSEIRALEAAVATSQNQLDYAVLTAPFDGEVAARYVDNFQTVQAKQPIVRLLDVAAIEVTVQIPETIVSLVPMVKQVICRFDALPDREFVGHVTKIGSEASQTTRTYPVTVEIEQPEDVRILPGMAATVRNKPDEAADEADGELVIPPAAVFADTEQQSYVWVVDEGSGTVARKPVTTGELTPVGLAVTEGLERGEWVVTAGVNSLREGQQVRIVEE
ncbi:MAG: efflux RND transporter periplasmic adaptor subunit [Maioricimonas sp. JB045]|uniref:efflux RND transporter periplasmic adaptor subunit n=1 Tax=Maioricimonas sp. JC845 TaxID=3232138 RepID=UPI00345AA05E